MKKAAPLGAVRSALWSWCPVSRQLRARRRSGPTTLLSSFGPGSGWHEAAEVAVLENQDKAAEFLLEPGSLPHETSSQCRRRCRLLFLQARRRPQMLRMADAASCITGDGTGRRFPKGHPRAGMFSTRGKATRRASGQARWRLLDGGQTDPPGGAARHSSCK